jgi:hypothetical protein
MPKATVLTSDALDPAVVKSPAAATAPRAPQSKPGKTASVELSLPLQIRLPRSEVKAIKVAAAQSEQTIRDFMLACLHAFMKSRSHE